LALFRSRTLEQSTAWTAVSYGLPTHVQKWTVSLFSPLVNKFRTGCTPMAAKRVCNWHTLSQSYLNDQKNFSLDACMSSHLVVVKFVEEETFGHRRSRWGPNTVILCFERRFPNKILLFS